MASSRRVSACVCVCVCADVEVRDFASRPPPPRERERPFRWGAPQALVCSQTIFTPALLFLLRFASVVDVVAVAVAVVVAVAVGSLCLRRFDSTPAAADEASQ